MNSEPMKAPARPDVAGELRESGLVKILVLKLFSITPEAFISSATWRTSGLSCCCSAGNERSILPASQTSTLALPGILTGAIIGVAQALGETAPLLLIGMSAFVASVPATPFDQSTALPVQIFLWQGNELRNFFEGRTAAAIIVLLAMMISLNSLAIWLRKKFEVRW